MATTIGRRVRRVRLRAEDAAAAQRGLLLLEDALHTAALPDAGGRLLIVRRLNVGAIDPRRGPNRVALAVEARLREIDLHAVAADEPGNGQAAAHAGAVSFRDAVAPCVALALRLAQGQSVGEWYWPLAVAGWRTDLARAEGLRRAVLRAADVLPHAAGARQVAAALAQAGQVGPLLAALEPGDAARLLELQGIPPALFAPTARHAPHSPAAHAAFSTGESPVLRAAPVGFWRAALTEAARLGTEDARLWWLALAAVAEVAPALLLAPEAAAQAARQAVAALAGNPTAAPYVAPAAQHRRGSASILSQISKSLSIPEPAGPEPKTTYAQATTPTQERLGGAPTAGGGLLFTLPLLEALGFAAWLAAHPALAAARLPERLLLLLAGRAGLPPGDAMVEWLAEAVQDAPAAAGVDDACRMWRAGLRGWLARRARLTLRELIVRPALLVATPTHVDVTFDLALADLRIRRLGLDVDPGWVTWLGRVVQFRYADRETR